MADIAEVIIGCTIIILNLLPFIARKPRYLQLTGIVSLMMMFLLLALK